MEGETIKKGDVKLLPKKRVRKSKKPLDPKRAFEFGLYRIWKTIPVQVLRTKINGHDAKAKEIAAVYGITDENLIELIDIKTQGQFAEKYDLAIETLTDWNKAIMDGDLMKDIRSFGKHLMRSVLMSMYQNATMKGGTSFKDRENLFKIIMQWSDKMDVKVDVGDTLADILRQKHGHGNPRIKE